MNQTFFVYIAHLVFFISFFVFSDGTKQVMSNDDQKSSVRVVDEVIHLFMQKYAISGVAVALIDGENEQTVAYGIADERTKSPVGDHTIFEIASVTKVFTTTALAIHVLKGDMALDDPITNYIPALSHQTGAVKKVTLLELATHTSSFPRVGGDWHLGGARKIFLFLEKWHPEIKIGPRYAYSNLAFGLLGYALENVERKTYEQVIRDAILRPLGMNSTFAQVPSSFASKYAQGYTQEGKIAKRRQPGYIPGSGALRSTSKDMLLFLKANMGLTGPRKLREAMKLAQQPYYKVRDDFEMGLGWQRFEREGTLIIDKNGGLSGFTSYIGWIPGKRLGVVILTNKGKADTTEVGRSILERLQALQ